MSGPTHRWRLGELERREVSVESYVGATPERVGRRALGLGSEPRQESGAA
jgi:hypothetical protein